MADSRTNPKVDAYFANATKWREELEELRRILLECDVTEELKWRQPCYTFEGSNIAILQAFNDSCDLMFFKGALLKDTAGVLQDRGPNTRSARMIRFTDPEDVAEMEPIIKACVSEAIEIEKCGREVDFKQDAELEYPDELQRKFQEMPEFKNAFEQLTPGRQRGYALYFSEAKQAKTRESRIEKHMQKILDGKGLNDR